MKVSNEIYKCCPKCGAEAKGLNNIDKVFGYEIVKDNIQPYAICRKCRNKAKKAHWEQQWATAADWGRKISISRKVFESYLIELGYLEYDYNSNKKGRNLVVTEKGSEHSATTDSPFHKTVLWDTDTFMEVVRLRSSRAILHDICPNCKAYLDTMPGFSRSAYSHLCRRCGQICNYWHVGVTYDR